MADILNCNDSPKGKRLSSKETGEVWNALSERVNALKKDLARPPADMPDNLRKALSESLERCEKLLEVFE